MRYSRNDLQKIVGEVQKIPKKDQSKTRAIVRDELQEAKGAFTRLDVKKEQERMKETTKVINKERKKETSNERKKERNT